MLHGPRARAIPRARGMIKFDIFFYFPQNLKNLVHSKPSLYSQLFAIVEMIPPAAEMNADTNSIPDRV